MEHGQIRKRLNRALSISASGFIAVVLATHGAPVQSETLRDALATAYRSNPQLDAERARLRATDEEVARANSGFRPTISGSADVSYNNSTSSPRSGTDGKTYPKSLSLNLSQPIFRGFRTFGQLREAEANVRAGREALRRVEQDVLLAAATAYMDVVRDQAIVKLNENNVTVLSRDLRATQDRFNVGEVTRTDVAQAQARRSGAVSALELARANLKSSRAEFERVIGRRPGRLVEPAVPWRRLPKSLQQCQSIAGQEQPDLVAALYREQAARHTITRIRGELLPEVRLEASHSKRFALSEFLDERESTAVVGRLNVPIYSGGEVSARVRQAKHTHVSRLQEVEQARTLVHSTVVSAWALLQAARAQRISAEAQVRANRTALQGVREEERVGQRTLLDVLNAEQELLNSQVGLVTNKRNEVVGAYTLLAAIGRLNVQELGLTSTVYDPAVHYSEVRRKWWGIRITHPDGRKEAVDAWSARGDRAPMK